MYSTTLLCIMRKKKKEDFTYFLPLIMTFYFPHITNLPIQSKIPFRNFHFSCLNFGNNASVLVLLLTSTLSSTKTKVDSFLPVTLSSNISAFSMHVTFTEAGFLITVSYGFIFNAFTCFNYHSVCILTNLLVAFKILFTTSFL